MRAAPEQASWLEQCLAPCGTLTAPAPHWLEWIWKSSQEGSLLVSAFILKFGKKPRVYPKGVEAVSPRDHGRPMLSVLVRLEAGCLCWC